MVEGCEDVVRQSLTVVGCSRACHYIYYTHMIKTSVYKKN